MLLMRHRGLLAPQRLARDRRPGPHSGSIIPGRPDALWAVVATNAHTVLDGERWVFACVDHVSAEAWASTDVRGDLAALEPLSDAVRDHSGPVGPE
jgi:hypothetical protein